MLLKYVTRAANIWSLFGIALLLIAGCATVPTALGNISEGTAEGAEGRNRALKTMQRDGWKAGSCEPISSQGRQFLEYFQGSDSITCVAAMVDVGRPSGERIEVNDESYLFFKTAAEAKEYAIAVHFGGDLKGLYRAATLDSNPGTTPQQVKYSDGSAGYIFSDVKDEKVITLGESKGDTVYIRSKLALSNRDMFSSPFLAYTRSFGSFIEAERNLSAQILRYGYRNQERNYTDRTPHQKRCEGMRGKEFKACHSAEMAQRSAEAKENARTSNTSTANRPYDSSPRPREKTENEKWRSCHAAGRSGCGYQ